MKDDEVTKAADGLSVKLTRSREAHQTKSMSRQDFNYPGQMDNQLSICTVPSKSRTTSHRQRRTLRLPSKEPEAARPASEVVDSTSAFNDP
jgi:hypothetical protein